VFLRLLLLLTFFVFDLFGCQGGYKSCIEKINDSHSIVAQQLNIALPNRQRLLYAEEVPHAKIIKEDPFLGLYLVFDPHPFAYPFYWNFHLQLGTAMVNTKRAVEGRFRRRQEGLNHLALYSEKIFYPALVTNSCCSLEGITTPRGIIQKEYLQHFVLSKDRVMQYGDIGIRLDNKGKKICVAARDPFFKNNPFAIGDQILSLDGKKVKDRATLMRSILFTPVGKKHTVVVIRSKKRHSFSVVTQKRFGGGIISDTFLESQGLFFDKRLNLVKLSKYWQQYGLKRGDRLLGIDRKLVYTIAEVRKSLQKVPKENYLLLFERNEFEFFVNLKYK